MIDERKVSHQINAFAGMFNDPLMSRAVETSKTFFASDFELKAFAIGSIEPRTVRGEVCSANVPTCITGIDLGLQVLWCPIPGILSLPSPACFPASSCDHSSVKSIMRLQAMLGRYMKIHVCRNCSRMI